MKLGISGVIISVIMAACGEKSGINGINKA